MLTKLTPYLAALLVGAATVTVTMPAALAHRPVSSSKIAQWNDLSEFQQAKELRDILLKRDWVSEKVSIHDFDQIMVTTEQLTYLYFPNVPTPLALGLMSVESGFRSDLESPAGAVGIAQVIPKWHLDRAKKYTDDPKPDLSDTYLNIATGLDYLNELLEKTEGDVAYALMCYNMGEKRATEVYLCDGRESTYAQMVIERTNLIAETMMKWEDALDVLPHSVSFTPYPCAN